MTAPINIQPIEKMKTKVKSEFAQRKPGGRSLAEFSLLFPKERQLLNECSGFYKPTPLGVTPNKPLHDNRVRAEFLRFLLLGGDDAVHIHEQGVRLAGAWIEGELNLESTQFSTSFIFANCNFVNKPVFTASKIVGSAVFYGCHLPGISATSFSCEGTFTVRNCKVSANIVMVGACISGDVRFDGSEVKSIVASRLSVTGKISFGKGFISTGAVNITGGRIGGTLDCSGAILNNPGKQALNASGITIGADVLFGKKFSSLGSIDLGVSRIGQNIQVKDAVFDGAGSTAFSANGAVISGGVFIGNSSFKGEIGFLSVSVESDFYLRESELQNKKGDAISCDRASLKGGVRFQNVKSHGAIRFLSAYIGANLDFRGLSVKASENGSALEIDRATVKGNLYLSEKFEAFGEVKLSSARIGLSVICTGGRFENKGGNAITAQGIQIQDALYFSKLTIPANGVILSSGRVGRLVDDENSWGSRLVLNGFVYGSIAGGSPTNAISRLNWLKKQRVDHFGKIGKSQNFRPQPWKQLRKVLFETGHFEDANQIAIAYQKHIFDIGLIGQTSREGKGFFRPLKRLIARAAHNSFGVLIGYGYRPMRLVAWMVSIWLICGMIYWFAALDGLMAPSNPLIFQDDKYLSCVGPKSNWYLCEKLREEYSGFSPLAYSLDVLLPVVDLQQENDWSPMVPTPKSSWLQELLNFTPKHLVRLLLWAEIIFGWISSLLLIAVVSGLTKRTED